MMILIASALVAAPPAGAPATAQHAQMAPVQNEAAKKDCCKDCCKDMAKDEGHGSERGAHSQP